MIAPIYLVSPQLLVTKEHIISDSASISASVCFSASRDDPVLCGLARALSCVEASRGSDSGEDARASDGGRCEGRRERLPPLAASLANRFSSALRSILVRSSSSESTPDNCSKDSIRANRFSRPSTYFALRREKKKGGERRNEVSGKDAGLPRGGFFVPFGRSSFLLDVREDALGLIVQTMSACR